jgi:hypothetical protein
LDPEGDLDMDMSAWGLARYGLSGAQASNINRAILGLPPRFPDLSDPSARVYTETFLNNANIVTFVPGKPTFVPGNLANEKYEAYKALMRESNEDRNNDLDGLFSNQADNEPELNKDYYKDNMALSNVKSERDLRFYSFSPDMYEYRRILNVLLNEVGGKMVGLALGGRNISKYLDLSQDGYFGFNVWMESSTSISESAANTIGDSMLAGTVKGVSEKAREAAFLSGMDTDAVNARLGQSYDKSFGQDVLDTVQSAASSVAGLFGGNKASSAVNAESILYPKMWKESTFDKSYNLSFKFISPYGNPKAIFENVYIPFLSLLAIALPRQTKPDAYKSPMLLRLDCPGYFNCDMGMVTSFTFVKGGSDNLWTANGYPRCIDVSMTISDMYPTLSAAVNMALIRENLGMSAFLDNMAGLSMYKVNLVEQLSSRITGMAGAFAGNIDDVFLNAKTALTNVSLDVFGRR